ncbi:hypothetical protein BDN71DRAFT_937684 [Pleurotus eryngii]|uniref:Uncharacterized protein n=1 Tax=Pleurotus eryngii TaxID=5323 RepID=A0A9P5ZXZ9_PLEER|nr:hypothetical protein BDN71DRAFT_937684 [Pleurotus eryngii]
MPKVRSLKPKNMATKHDKSRVRSTSPTASTSLSQPQSRAGSKVKVLKHLIPKPPGSAGRNYNLQHAMGGCQISGRPIFLS